MITAVLCNSEKQNVSQHSKLEGAYTQVNDSLSTITQELYLKKAA